MFLVAAATFFPFDSYNIVNYKYIFGLQLLSWQGLLKPLEIPVTIAIKVSFVRLVG